MLSINFNNNLPIHEQIKRRIEELILNGVLEKDSALPSVRELACSLAINPNTVQKAYFALESDGITYSVAGKGRFVALHPDELKKAKAEEELKAIRANVEKLYNYGFSKKDVMIFIEDYIKEIKERSNKDD